MKRKAIIWVAMIWFAIGCSDQSMSNSIPHPVVPSLSHSWKAFKVVQNQQDISSEYANFKITIQTSVSGANAFDYTTSGITGLSVWPTSGRFAEGGSSTLLRDDQTNIVYKLSSDSLQFNFDYQGTGFQNRLYGVSGAWQMLFVKI